jgi:hypothetical protein
MLDVIAVTPIGPDGGVCTGGPDNGIPDMIITIPLDIRMAYVLTIIFFGPEVMMGFSGVGRLRPLVVISGGFRGSMILTFFGNGGKILFRGTLTSASQLAAA